MGQPQPVSQTQPRAVESRPFDRGAAVKAGIAVVLVAACYYRVCRELYSTWVAADSYYLHGFLIPPISLFFAWRIRRRLLETPVEPAWWGLLLVGLACVMLLLSDLLGIRVAGQLSIVVLAAGVIAAFWGARRLALLWFPIAFLLMMIPIPTSIIQSLALEIKLLATEAAVRLARMAFLPIIREGSYVHFGNDHFIIGDVCGGLRSLISLLAVGAVVAYLSGARPWARVVLFIVSAPIAVIANIFRIFLLCVVGYFWGSKTATGRFHDISGILIFLVAFLLLFSLDAILRRLAPEKKSS